MDEDNHGVSSLRKQRTLEIKDDENGINRRPNSRIQAVSSVREITKSLSKRSITSSQSKRIHNNSQIARSFSNKEESYQKLKSTTQSKKSSSLSKTTSVTAKNGPMPKLSTKSSLPKQPSKSMSAKNLLISRLSKQRSIQTDENETELWYHKGSFVATRAPDEDCEDYYICIVLRDIYNFTKKVKVRWLDRHRHQKSPCRYKMKYLDSIDPACILLEVKTNQLSRLFYDLPLAQHDEILSVLKMVKDLENGKLKIDNISDDVHEVKQVDEPPKKHPKLMKSASKKNDASKSTRKKAKLIKSASQKIMKKVKKSAQKKEKPDSKSRKKKDGTEITELKRKKPTPADELKLTPRQDVKVLDKDPLFETRTPMPYVSKSANAKLIFRAIALKDEKLLKKLLKDKQNIYWLYNKSVDFEFSPLEATVKANDLPLFKILLQEFLGKKFEARKVNNFEDRVSLDKLDTGQYNPKSLGVSRILKIQASRGSKEGNNAFLKTENKCSPSNDQAVLHASLIPHGAPHHFVEELIKFTKETEEQFYNSINGGHFFIDLLLMGCHKLAGKIVKHSNGWFFRKAFNQLIKEILTFETEELTSCPPSAVKFAVKKIDKLTPFHYAAINPNPKYLERLLTVEPLAHISDMRGRRPIHFAACCSSADNLELLFKWGANLYETCQSHKLPLHYAINARRPENVKVLLERASKNAGPDIAMTKFGPGGINCPFPNGMSPLHRAVELEEKEIVELLLSYGAPVNAKSSVTSMQVTALMAAAATGNLDTVKLLVEHGAVVEQKDRLGRTALIHACRNGATKVLSYLIRIGSNPELPDSSTNYPIHYAAAYGWLFTVRFLIEVGVDINVLNMWKFSPVSVAFVKGHVGIVRELLLNEKVDINQTMEDGTSLLFQACESDLCQDDLYEQIEYLVKKKGAMCNIKDVNGKTALFYLAQSQIDDPDKVTQAQNQSIKIANLLIDHGCDISAVDNEGFTAAMAALSCMTNLPLAEALIKKGCKVLSPPETGPEERPKDNLLHAIVKNFHNNEGKALQVLHLLKKHKFVKEGKESARHQDSDGYTPLLLICRQWCRNFLHQERPSSFTSKEEEKSWDEVLDFFKFLITTFEADVNTKVTEKFMTLEERLSVTVWSQKYASINDGGKTALHLLLHDDPKFHLLTTKSATRASLIICHLLEKGANINYHDVEGVTPLGTAVKRGYVSTVDYLIKHTKCNLNLPIKLENRFEKEIEEHPHNYAATHSNSFNTLQMFSTLIDGGIDVNARSQVHANHKGTFLHLLFQNQNDNRSELGKLVDKLSETAFDFDAQNNEGMTVLHLAFRSNKSQLNDSLELESKLLAKCSLKIQDKKQRTPLHYICKEKNRSYFYRRNEQNSNPSQLLRLVCQKADKSIINQQDHDGKTILHMASELGYFVCIYLLTKNKDSLDIHLRDYDGNTALSLAVKNGHDSCALALIQCGASLKDEVINVSAIEQRRRREEREKAADNGIEDDKTEAADEEDNDSDLKAKGWSLKAFQSVKEEAAVSREHLYKATLNQELPGTLLQILDGPKEKTGLTPKDMIWMAMENGKYNIALQIMHASTSNPKSSNLLKSSYEMGRNLLHLLPLSSENTPREDYSSFIEIAKLLMSYGISSSSVDKYGCTPIQYAILNRHLELANLLAETGSGFDVSKKDNFGRGYLAALMWRIHSKGIDGPTWDLFEKLIIEKKLNLDTVIDLPLCPDILEMDASGWNIQKDPDYWQRYPDSKTTALIAAIRCSEFNKHISHNLLQFGANPNTPDGNNVNPLMHAVMQNKVHFVRQLLHYDYDPNARETPTSTKATKEKKKHKLNTGIFRLVASAATESDESSEESDMEVDNSDKIKHKEEEKDESCLKAFKPVTKTSSIKLDQKDNDGRTALHYVAAPSPLGTFDNAEMAFVLIKGGAKSVTDKFGFTPFTLAAETCATKVIEQLKLLGHGTNRSVKIQYKDNFMVDDGVNFDGKQDFMKDAEKVLRRHDSEMEVDDIYIHEVDENCNVTNGELMKDKDMDIWFDILMTKVDVRRLEWGLYNFYKLQLVYQPDKKLYILFTRWGRIGETGQFQHTPFHDEAAAIKEFSKIFREKSGNKWTDIKRYERKPKKYRLLEDWARKAPPEQKDVDLDLKTKVHSTLPQHLYLLVRRLMSPKVMEVSMRSSRCINEASLPFGQLNKERLLQGKRLLERIEKYITEVEEYKKSLKKSDVDKEKMEAIEKNCELIAELSNDYFHVIPQQNFSCERCEPLNARTIIEHLYFISNMLNYELVSKMLLAAMTHKAKTNPADFVYRCLGCQIELMQEEDPVSQLILRYVHLTSRCKVLRIYKLSREGEEERLKATQIGNHHLLWHGTHSTNLLSILTRGMLVSPPDANHTAWAFGKGVYFADEFSKSANYVHSSAGGRLFMLLCQVALGNCVPYEDPSTVREGAQRNKKPKNSTVVESNAFQTCDWLVLNTGAKIPYSKRSSSYGHRSREYIVENPAQICLRYLIEYTAK